MEMKNEQIKSDLGINSEEKQPQYGLNIKIE